MLVGHMHYKMNLVLLQPISIWIVDYSNKQRVMDFRMDKSSWVMLAFMLITFMFFILEGAGGGLPLVGYFQAFGFSLLVMIALVAIMCIPVLIYCFIVKMIPDIDYSIRAAFAMTIIGIISEIIL
jgi:phosphoglycerol transferase MdoB-like AlkP superfamily enzyme